MLTRQVLGCRGSEPTGGRLAGSQLAAVFFVRNERSARMAGGTCTEHSVCGGSDRDSINAVEINGASGGDE